MAVSTVQLKGYQQEALERLDSFLAEWAELGSVAEAFREVSDSDYQSPSWPKEDKELRRWTPSVCLKAGTGAGKTLMAATWLQPIAESVAGGPTPLRLVLWLVPTKTLIDQTIRALRDPKGMYRPTLEAAFGPTNVVGREALLSIAPSQLADGLTIVVSTAQGFRREEKEGLRAYRENGALMGHFTAPATDAWLGEDGQPLTGEEVVPSAVNVSRLHRPVVVVDEAHRNQSALSWEMLGALRPRFVLELTATPRPAANVLTSVLPIRLKEEEMIRMPVNLYRCEGWMDALADAQKNRDGLESAARKAKERIRPIVLIQAEAKDEAHSHLEKGKVAVFDVVAFLEGQLKVEREEIAIRTGTVDELTGRDLLASDCVVRYVVTVQAAAEGWDCPFATTLAAMSATKSKLKVTQLLGRCVRQDLARKSSDARLNETYVFTATPAFTDTAQTVIGSMEELGFSGADLKLHEKGKRSGGSDPDISALRPVFEGEKIPTLYLRSAPKGKAAPVESPNQFVDHATAKLRLDRVDGIVKPVAPSDAARIDFDLDGKLIQTELNLPSSPTDSYEEFDESILVNALSRSVRDQRIDYQSMTTAIAATVEALKDNGWTLSEMFGNYRLISGTIKAEMSARYEQLVESGIDAAFQGGLLTAKSVPLPSELLQPPVVYIGLDQSKHLYGTIGLMNEPELFIAEALATSQKVKWWWRNPDRTGWFMVGKWGRFFPDFIARFNDGRLVVIEHKGSQLIGNVDTKAKEDLGALWATVAGSRSTFYLVTQSPDQNRPAQISPTDLAQNVLGVVL